MSAPASAHSRILLLALRTEGDVVVCRKRARSIAAELGFDQAEQVRVATAVSEISRNAVQYGRDAEIEFTVPPGRRTLRITVTDHGPGIPDLDAVLAGRRAAHDGGTARGITGARRLMHRMTMRSTPQGTTVEMEVDLPGRAPGIAPAAIARLAAALAASLTPEPLEELAEQNRELVRLMEEVQSQREELRQRGDDLQRVNAELAETNRGVLALYDELDTLHRLSRVIASQLDLDSLAQAIIDSTTEISGAELGAFYLVEASGGMLRCQAKAGILQEMLNTRALSSLRDLAGVSDLSEVIRHDDLATASAPAFLAGSPVLRSLLVVPVQEVNGQISSIMIFGHRTPGHFVERTERIMASVATQAAVGLTNAKLYGSVQAASAAKDHFLATLSHELRTPLNPVFVILSGLEDHADLPEEVRSDVRIMRRNLELEARLIDDLLDMTKIVRGKLSLRHEVVDVYRMLRAVADICGVTARDKGVEVELVLDAGEHHVSGDGTRLQQVFWNLVNNAIKFTPPGGRASLACRNEGKEWVVIAVHDTGRGIDPGRLEDIFRAFDQGETGGMQQYGGLGLGLAIARTIIDAHGGTIVAESAGTDEGATFTVRLRAVPFSEAAASRDAAATGTALKKSHRILLVDDHLDTLDTLQRLLKRRGHEVRTASTCAEARAMAAEQDFDWLISDIGLPDCSGVELMQTLRGKEGLRAIALSGYGAEADIQRSLDAGFTAHLTKPVDFPALEQALAR